MADLEMNLVSITILPVNLCMSLIILGYGRSMTALTLLGLAVIPLSLTKNLRNLPERAFFRVKLHRQETSQCPECSL